MSFSTSARSLPRRFGVVLASFLQQSGLPFSDVLPEDRIQAAFDEEGVAFAQEEDEIYTPQVTLWAFLSQVLFTNEQRSCVAAVSRVIVLLVALGQEPPSSNTGAYCRARAKLPAAVIRRLACELADGCERNVPQQWLWHGRQVKLVDGSTASMPDTEANQAEYPQHTAQQEGLGSPILRFVVLLSLATAMISDLASGPYAGKETAKPPCCASYSSGWIRTTSCWPTATIARGREKGTRLILDVRYRRTDTEREADILLFHLVRPCGCIATFAHIARQAPFSAGRFLALKIRRGAEIITSRQ